MIEARKASVWKSRYDLIADGRRVATWEGSSWRYGGTVELGGRLFEVKANVWGSTYELVDEHGTRVASADRVGRRSWTVEAEGATYRFRRAPMWRKEEEMLLGGRRVGAVTRKSIWRSDAVADLPGVPLAVAVFILAVVLTHWDWDAVSSAAGS